MAEGGSDTAREAALEATIASSERGQPADRSGDALGATLAAADEAVAAAIELPDVAPDRYRLGEEIGRGGLGKVVSARDRNLGRQVAIKALHAEGASARRRFVREALITARLEHPSIVPVHDAGRWPDGSPFYAMKLVRGRPLAAVIDEQHDLASRLALVPTVLAVCDAVAYAHSERVVHRDLKPHNVLVGEFGETVVIDWGLAKDLAAAESVTETETEAETGKGKGKGTGSSSTETVAGSVLGTPAYMAPEQALGGAVDERADVYALGAMLYHVLVGKPPHDGGSVDEVLDHAVTGAVVPLTTRAPGVPRDLAAIVAKAMSRAAGDRYPSARELAEDLRRFTTGQLVGAHRYTWSQRARRWLRRHRAIAITVAAAVAAVAAIATLSLRDVLRERDRADQQRDMAIAASARADEQRAAAQAAGNRATLAQARAAIARDPAEALAWLATLSVDGPGWDAARTIAADALWRDPPERVLRGHHGTPRGLAAADPHRVLTWDDGAVWIWDLATGAGRSYAVPRTHNATGCPDGARIIGQGIEPGGGELGDYSIDTATGDVSWGEVAPAVWAACGDPPPQVPDDCFLPATTGDGAFAACGDPSVYANRPGKKKILRAAPARFIAVDDRRRWIAVDGTAGGGPGVDVFSIDTGAIAWSVPTEGDLRELALSGDGRWLLVLDDRALLVDLDRGDREQLGGPRIEAAAFLPDGRVVAVAADRTVRAWTPALPPPRIAGLARDAAGLSADGKIAVLAGRDGVVRRVESGRVVATAPIGAVEQIAVAADGAVIAAVRLHVWAWRPNEPARLLGDHTDATHPHADVGTADVGWLPGGDGVSWNGESVRIWSGAGARTIAIPPPPPRAAPATTHDIVVVEGCPEVLGAAPRLAIAPQGGWIVVTRDIASACDGLVYLVDTGAGAVYPLDGAVGRHPAFTADGRALVTGAVGGGVQIWDLATRRARRIDGHLMHPHAVATSADGHRLAITGEGGALLVDTATGATTNLDVDDQFPLSAWFSPDGAVLAVAAASGVWTWDLASGERRHVGISLPLAVHVGADQLDAISDGRVWQLHDDLPRAPAELAKRLAALGYSLPGQTP